MITAAPVGAAPEHAGPPSGAAQLVVENLTKRFDGRPVLSDLNLAARASERLVVIGPSGSGKSTLLRCIMGLEEIEAGRILLDGKPCVERRPNRTVVDRLVQRHIGMVFQHYTLFPHLTVMENLVLAPVKVWGEKPAAARQRASAFLYRLGLEEKAAAYPGRLSGGQKQRVAIARALMLEPRVMLFDEVTSALDPELVAEVLDVMLDLAEQQMSMLIITHEMTFARRIASRILFIDDGRILEEAPPEEFFGHPREERTARFLKHFFGVARRPLM